MKIALNQPFSLFLKGAFWLILLGFGGCADPGPEDYSTEDISVSGTAAGTVGGALAGSLASGNHARMGLFGSYEISACPTVLSFPGTGCTNVSSGVVSLTYNRCSFGTSTAIWTAIDEVSASGLSCQTFPKNTVTRQFVASSGGAPGTGTRIAISGTTATVDHATANLGNYQGDTISTVTNGGYGTVVTWAGGVRTGLSINERVFTTAFDHSITGSGLTISESLGSNSRTVSGGIVVYDNILTVESVSVFNSVVYEDSCCYPTSGSITSNFSSTSKSGIEGQKIDGFAETLTFTGCGTASLQAVDGSTTDVLLVHCL